MNGIKSIFGEEIQKAFAPKVESMENTDQHVKDEKLIEKKLIITQEFKLGGHEVPCDFNFEKNDFSMETNKPKMKS